MDGGGRRQREDDTGRKRDNTRTRTHLHSNAEVHHGDAGVAVPADVHGGVATVTLALQR